MVSIYRERVKASERASETDRQTDRQTERERERERERKKTHVPHVGLATVTCKRPRRFKLPFTDEGSFTARLVNVKFVIVGPRHLRLGFKDKRSHLKHTNVQPMVALHVGRRLWGQPRHHPTTLVADCSQ